MIIFGNSFGPKTSAAFKMSLLSSQLQKFVLWGKSLLRILQLCVTKLETWPFCWWTLLKKNLQAVERLVASAESGCTSKSEQVATLNCVRLMTRILPYIFEDPDWRGFFWSSLPAASDGRTRNTTNDEDNEESTPPLAQSLLNALSVSHRFAEILTYTFEFRSALGIEISEHIAFPLWNCNLQDLLFCPEFTVHTTRKGPVSQLHCTWLVFLVYRNFHSAYARRFTKSG